MIYWHLARRTDGGEGSMTVLESGIPHLCDEVTVEDVLGEEAVGLLLAFSKGVLCSSLSCSIGWQPRPDRPEFVSPEEMVRQGPATIVGLGRASIQQLLFEHGPFFSWRTRIRRKIIFDIAGVGHSARGGCPRLVEIEDYAPR